MRNDDVTELLNEVTLINQEIEKNIERANKDLNIKEIVKPKVKSSLEHLRSCLDYLSHDIYDYVYASTDGLSEDEREKKIVYFPYGRNSNDFHSSLGKSFKNIKNINPDIYNLLESIQPYASGQNWLIDLCQITNSMKHNKLFKQKRRDNKDLKVGNFIYISGFNKTKSIDISNNCFNGKMQKNSISIENGEIVTDIDKDDLDIEIINWANFTFDGTSIQINNLLGDTNKEIFHFQDSLYKIIIA